VTDESPRTIALLHPGAMGVTVGGSLAAGGHQVRWLAAERSAATRSRATQAGFVACRTLAEVLDGAHGVISVCPPAQALNVAGRVGDCGFQGIYVDANAIAPATARQLAQRLGEGFVDGGIIGPPAHQAGTTRLYLSGPGATAAAAWFAAGPLAAIALEGPAGAASALKMCNAAYTKGTSALLLAVRALARAEQVDPALLDEWALSQPGLAERSDAAARATAPKAWRFVGEMQEIAATFAAAGLPPEFHRAAAEVYERMTPLKDEAADLEAVLRRLLEKA